MACCRNTRSSLGPWDVVLVAVRREAWPKALWVKGWRRFRQWHAFLLDFISFLISKSIGLASGLENHRMSCRRFKNCLNTAKDECWKDEDAILFARPSVIPSGKSTWLLNVGSASENQSGASVPCFLPSDRVIGDAELIVNQMADRGGWKTVSVAGWGSCDDSWEIEPGDGHMSARSRNFSMECCKSVLDTNNWKSFRRRNRVSSWLSSDKGMPPTYE